MATRPIRRFKGGTQLIFKIEVRDATDDLLPLFDPASVPQILVRDSNGAVVQNYSNMTRQASGVYNYQLQTTSAGPFGVWQVGFKATDGSTVVVTPEEDGFTLVP